MAKPDTAISAHTRKQHGLITRDQAVELGLSANAIARRVKDREWRKVLPNVYADASAPATWTQKVMAAWLWAGRDAAVSHSTAAALWKLEGFKEDEIEITTTRRLKHEGVVVHHRSLGSVDSGRMGALRITSPTRTLLDLCCVADPRKVEKALDDALRRRITSLDKLSALVDRVGDRGVRGCRLLRGLIAERRRIVGMTDSTLESDALAMLRAEGFPLPTLQYKIRRGGRVLARVDLAYPEAMVAIEVSSYTYHSIPNDWERDHTRHNGISSLGWSVLYITRRQLRGAPRRKFVADLRQALGHSFQQKLS